MLERGPLTEDDIENQAKLLRRRPRHEVASTMQALRLHPWLNTYEERCRLAACRQVLAELKREK